MCLGADGELEGQVSLNELLVAMGELPIGPPVPAPVLENAAAPAEPPELPGL